MSCIIIQSGETILHAISCNKEWYEIIFLIGYLFGVPLRFPAGSCILVLFLHRSPERLLRCSLYLKSCYRFSCYAVVFKLSKYPSFHSLCWRFWLTAFRYFQLLPILCGILACQCRKICFTISETIFVGRGGSYTLKVSVIILLRPFEHNYYMAGRIT